MVKGMYYLHWDWQHKHDKQKDPPWVMWLGENRVNYARPDVNPGFMCDDPQDHLWAPPPELLWHSLLRGPLSFCPPDDDPCLIEWRKVYCDRL